MSIGPRLRQLRCSKGWSQEQLAAYAGISRGTANEVESGKTNASARVLEGLADALDVEVGDLFKRAGTTHRNG
jgi:XRE family transcriptional regulator, regulator of sulfur utilization